MAELTTNTLLSKSPTMLAPKAPAPTATAVAAQAAFITKPKPVKAARLPKLLSDPTADYMKILFWGATGSGKTMTIAGLLELGLTVLVISCDIGGAGTASVQQYLRKRGKEDLLANAFLFEMADYDEMEDFCFNPSSFWPDIFTKDIDVLVLDGLSSFQICHVQDKAMAMEALGGDKEGEGRTAGLRAGQSDWGVIKAATVKNLNKFLLMRNPITGKAWHKIVTCLETDKAKDNMGEIKQGPYLQGASAKLLEPCFDLIIRTRKKRVTEGDKKVNSFVYEMDGSSDRIITKSRGFDFQPTEPADIRKLWISACEQRGISSGKK